MDNEDFLKNALEEIKRSSKDSSVYVGCDSNIVKKKSGWYASYARVIILHKDSKHGCKVFGDVKTLPDYGNLRQRLFQEVMFATDLALEVVDIVDGRTLEIHLDINTDERHKSSTAVKEALGYVRGMTGIIPKLKPESFAATHCADHYCRL